MLRHAQTLTKMFRACCWDSWLFSRGYEYRRLSFRLAVASSHRFSTFRIRPAYLQHHAHKKKKNGVGGNKSRTPTIAPTRVDSWIRLYEGHVLRLQSRTGDAVYAWLDALDHGKTVTPVRSTACSGLSFLLAHICVRMRTNHLYTSLQQTTNRIGIGQGGVEVESGLRATTSASVRTTSDDSGNQHKHLLSTDIDCDFPPIYLSVYLSSI
jgi:hypothetical protein